MEKQSTGMCLEGHNQRAIQSALENQKLCPICMQNLLRRWLSAYAEAEVFPAGEKHGIGGREGYYTFTWGNPDLSTLMEQTRMVLGR